ncbi:AAA family ATPase [Geodermatophilus sp. CPCC 206100]|uniref:AAA family ATPase n=1 Tax=Geodermatophilus sp. CPCC 206100 TaxID=3020054 RepID=UPI003AFF6DCD
MTAVALSIPGGSTWGLEPPRTARQVLGEMVGRPAFLLDGLIHPTATLLTGPPKSGKSFLVVEWVEALTTGQEWHSRAAPVSARALVLPTDPGGFEEYAGRLQSHVLDDVELAHPPRPGDLEGWGRLARYALDEGVGLVVLDNLYGYNPTADINNNGDVGVTLAGLGELARAGVPYLTVHHPAKGVKAGYAGTASIEAHFRHLVYMDAGGRLTIRGNTVTPHALQLVRGPDGRTVEAITRESSTSSAGSSVKVHKATPRQQFRERQVAQATPLLAEMPGDISDREKARRLIGAVEGINTEGKARTLFDLVEGRHAEAAQRQPHLDASNASTTG